MIPGIRAATTGRFIVVGLIATASYLISALAFGYAGFSPLLSNALAWTLSLIVSYAGQNYFTFRLGGQHRIFAPRFLVSTAALFAMSNVITFIITGPLHLSQPTAAWAVAIAYPPASFLVHSLWTFTHRTSPETSTKTE